LVKRRKIGSNIPATCYETSGLKSVTEDLRAQMSFLVFPLAHPGKRRQLFKSSHDASFLSFPIHYFLITLSFDITYLEIQMSSVNRSHEWTNK